MLRWSIGATRTSEIESPAQPRTSGIPRDVRRRLGPRLRLRRGLIAEAAGFMVWLGPPPNFRFGPKADKRGYC